MCSASRCKRASSIRLIRCHDRDLQIHACAYRTQAPASEHLRYSLLPLPRFDRCPFLWSGEASIFAFWDHSEILLSVICGVSILMIDIFAITLTNTPGLSHNWPGTVTLSPSLLLLWLSVVSLVLAFVISWCSHIVIFVYCADCINRMRSECITVVNKSLYACSCDWWLFFCDLWKRLKSIRTL